ncbi:MAG: two-component system sensor histidine kinase NtrB [Gemmatimonadales bacterium]
MNTNPPRHGAPDPRSGEFPVDEAASTSASPATAARGLGRLTVPGPRALLTGIIVARLLLVALIAGRELGTSDPAVASMAMVAAAALVASAWLGFRIRKPGQIPGPSALLLQAAVDVIVITSLISFTRVAATSVAALYIALVTVYALLLPVGRGLLAVGFAVACYVAVSLRAPLEPPDIRFWSQIAVIAFVGAFTAVLGNRLALSSREQKTLAAALAQARLEADEILGTIESGVLTVDEEGHLGYLNPRGRAILGGAGAQFVAGQPVLETLRARSRELFDAIHRGIQEGHRVMRAEAQVRRADGSLFPVGVSTTTFQRQQSERHVVTAIFTDISDLKRLQEFRLRAERLEAVAALSASLAHEIRNPLAAIRSAVEQLVRSAGPDEDDQTLARLVVRESERLNRLLGEFLDFSRVRAAKFERLDLADLVRDAARITGAHPDAREVVIAVEGGGESVFLDADSDLLNRMVSNLLLNAVQALNGRGTVTVTVGMARAGEERGGIDRPVKLVVSDDGPGIPEEVRGRLYEPFVTGRQGGTGLGLAIVQRAVTAHRGVILVDTAPGAGTRFSIFLPATWHREERT